MIPTRQRQTQLQESKTVPNANERTPRLSLRIRSRYATTRRMKIVVHSLRVTTPRFQSGKKPLLRERATGSVPSDFWGGKFKKAALDPQWIPSQSGASIYRAFFQRIKAKHSLTRDSSKTTAIAINLGLRFRWAVLIIAACKSR